MEARLGSLTPRAVIKVLEQHGFLRDHVTGSHYIFYHPLTKHRVVVAYHTRELPRGTLMSIIRSSGLEQEVFF
ncbi:MAG: type II toxin-antitoxin system HicA family toxin [Patescibacteria group bacterium]